MVHHSFAMNGGVFDEHQPTSFLYDQAVKPLVTHVLADHIDLMAPLGQLDEKKKKKEGKGNSSSSKRSGAAKACVFAYGQTGSGKVMGGHMCVVWIWCNSSPFS